MKKLIKFKEYCETKGLSYTLRFIFHKIKTGTGKVQGYNDLLYFLFHHNLNAGYKDDLSGWHVYIKLKKEFEKYMYSLPEYKVSDKKVKIIWWCWLQGEENAPVLCKKCLNSIRKHFPDYEVKVVTNDNMLDYIHLPQYILDKFNKGYFSRTHFSDILRTLLLVEHGGIWIDSTVYCTGRNDSLLSLPLFVYQDWKFNRKQAFICSSWFISAWKGDPILSTTRDLIFEYWKKHDFLDNYFLFHLFFHLATERYKQEWDKVPLFSNLPPHYLQFELFDNYSSDRYDQIMAAADFHKLTYKDQRMATGQRGSFYNHLILGE